jgi:hypothetical protein
MSMLSGWKLWRIGLIWLAWTAMIAICAYAYARSTLASANFALPLPTALYVGGHRFGVAAAWIAAIVWLLLWLYLPPILITLSWLVARRSKTAR